MGCGLAEILLRCRIYLNIFTEIKELKWKILSLLFILVIVFYIYPKLSSYFPRELKTNSSTLSVEGEYFPMTMNQLTKLVIDSNRVNLIGFDVSFLTPGAEYKIERDIPVKYMPLPEQDTNWVLPDSTNSTEKYQIRIFQNRLSKDKIKVWLPFGNAEPEWFAYKTENGNELLILSSGDFKRGENVYLGYILIKRKVKY